MTDANGVAIFENGLSLYNLLSLIGKFVEVK